MKPKARMPASFCTRKLLQLKEALKTVVLAGEWYGELHKVTKSGNEIIESRWTLVRDEGQQNQPYCRHRHHREETIRSTVSTCTAMESIGTLPAASPTTLTMCWLYDVRSTFANENLPERSQRLLKTVESNAKREQH